MPDRLTSQPGAVTRLGGPPASRVRRGRAARPHRTVVGCGPELGSGRGLGLGLAGPSPHPNGPESSAGVARAAAPPGPG
eukprot:scaffold34239_cov66-Phaeocystis_antarctica.AAC.3